ncbi:phosphotriesterase-related protein [Saccharopolyspora kobensis]|uniref:Phosphotriesterase-related protein n=1 Tax=Saccharopolyspora kobensis TaxID=146035 RepID=A0A1H6A693_9PSEU|nr:aryldialkylphosphatase [Saccharopolyspora kobensis]SEG44249.1 phosphotriesterase-related protein [Saccharopolyspora kobensis]SFE51365.1 phosphotriesterase-related protein [Saccharopolyspora kobensis]
MTVRTVLGDVPAQALGRTDYHEHLFQVSPLLPGDELDDELRSGQEAQSLREAGIDALVEATPIGLGRDPAGMARIAERTGLHVVATTGAHRQAHYPDGHPLLASTEEALAERFTAELVTGMSDVDGTGTGIRAGVLKAGIGYWSISAFERRVLGAVAVAHAATGAPVMVHLEHGSAAFEVLDELGSRGVRADRVVLAHADRNPDPGLHAELCSAGAYLGYDGMARHRDRPDSAVLDCLLATAERGGARRLLLGGDVARRSRYRAYGGLPGLAYLPARFLPRLVREGGAELAELVVVENPARFLDWADGN